MGHRRGWGRRQRQVAKGSRGRWMRRGREVTLSNMAEKGCIPFNFSVLKCKKSLIRWSQPTWCYNLISVVHVLFFRTKIPLVSPLFQVLHTRSRADVWCCWPPMRSHTRPPLTLRVTLPVTPTHLNLNEVILHFHKVYVPHWHFINILTSSNLASCRHWRAVRQDKRAAVGVAHL